MAIKAIKNVQKIGGFEVGKCDESMGVPIPNYLTGKKEHIFIDVEANIIAFRIQDGPIKEVGVNGCQVDTLIHAARAIIIEFNNKFPHDKNGEALDHLYRACKTLEERKKERTGRGVEGYLKV